ncbi:Exocyst complex component 5 [Lobulomyces angularis]|nr:Exocyst complex component 5 [Lobulomyces angularis]
MSNIKDIVNIESFRGRFDVKEFVETISNQHVIDAKVISTQFDPKPFIRTFEATVDELLKLKRKVQRKIDDLDDQAAATESSTRQKMQEITSTFENCRLGFESLETQINHVGATAVKIGEQLETIDLQRTKAVEAKDLIQYFLDFNQGISARLETLRKKNAAGEYNAVIIARRLSGIAKEVDVPEIEKARTNIEKYCEELEKGLLESFDKALNAKDRVKMKQYAKTLFDFNGGNSCLQTYINQNLYFINSSIIDCQHEFESLYNDAEFDTGIPKPDHQLIQYFDEIRKIVRIEWDMIFSVFVNSPQVLIVFVQRIFAQSVQTMIENLLLQAEKHSPITYLQVLASTHKATQNLILDLHHFDEEVIAFQVGAPVLTQILDRSFEDLFVPYLDGDKYINLEAKLFLTIYEQVLNPYQNFMLKRSKLLAKKGIKTKAFLGNLNASGSVLSNDVAIPSGFSSMSQVLSKLMGEKEELNASDDSTNIKFAAIDNVLKLIKPHIQAVNRCRQLVLPGNLPQRISFLFQLLLECLPQYLETSITICQEDFPLQDSKNDPDLKALVLVQSVTDILNLIQFHFQSAIVSKLLRSPATHREVVVYKNNLMSDVEEKLGNLVFTQIEYISVWFVSVLSKQKKNEFKPNDDQLNIGTLPTPPCIQITNFVKNMYKTAMQSLNGENLRVFLLEVGNSLHSLLLDHFKKYTINSSGGILLSKDLLSYQEAIGQFNLKELAEKFELLRELGNLFIVKPENIKQVLNEGILSRIELNLIYPYLICRSDWDKLKYFEREIFNMNKNKNHNGSGNNLSQYNSDDSLAMSDYSD